MTNIKSQSGHRNKHAHYKRKRNNKRRRSRNNRNNIKRFNQIRAILSPPPILHYFQNHQVCAISI